MRDDLERRFGQYLEPAQSDYDQTLLISTMFHPQKSLYLSEYLFGEGCRRLPLMFPSDQETDPPPLLDVSSPTTCGMFKKRRTVFSSKEKSISLEARNYLEMLTCGMSEQDENICPVEFWTSNKQRFPRLSSVAIHYLCVPATSASVERLFSVAGSMTSGNKHRLGPLLLEAETIASYNREK